MAAVSADAHAELAGPPPRILLAVIVSVFATALAGIAISWVHGTLMPVWIGTAIMVYWLLRRPRCEWPSIVTVCWLANVAAAIMVGRGMPRAVLLPTVNLTEAILVAMPLRTLRLDDSFARPLTLTVFYALVLGPATMLPASVGAFVTHRLTGVPFSTVWIEWYITTALGQAMLVPPLMVLRKEAVKAVFTRAQFPGTILLLAIVAAAISVNVMLPDYSLGFLFFPAVVLITFQRGFAGGVLGLILIVAYMALGLRDVHSTVSATDAHLHLILIQLYTAVISFTVVVVGAGLEQRRKLERNLAEARDAAEAASRAKTMFLANMSHELRTPLNAVIGFSDLMHEEMFGPLGNLRYRDYARHIHDAGQHLLDLIGDILDMSKIEAGKYEIACEDLQLDRLVNECIELMRPRATERRVNLASHLAGPEKIVADRCAMKQIVLNLLSNAIKFTPAGGNVTLSTHAMGNRLIVAVADTGFGIAATDLPSLGKPFVQLRRRTAAISAQPGTGLGLALVRALVEKHGGAFAIESQEGRGTRATIEMPLLVSASPDALAKTAA